MTTLQVTPKLVLIRDDNGDILAIGTELTSFGVIRQGVMHWMWNVVVILFHPGSLVREAHGGKGLTRTREDRVALGLGSRRSNTSEITNVWNVVQRSKKRKSR
jgi:hypothetical protein